MRLGQWRRTGERQQLSVMSDGLLSGQQGFTRFPHASRQAIPRMAKSQRTIAAGSQFSIWKLCLRTVGPASSRIMKREARNSLRWLSCPMFISPSQSDSVCKSLGCLAGVTPLLFARPPGTRITVHVLDPAGRTICLGQHDSPSPKVSRWPGPCSSTSIQGEGTLADCGRLKGPGRCMRRMTFLALSCTKASRVENGNRLGTAGRFAPQRPIDRRLMQARKTIEFDGPRHGMWCIIIFFPLWRRRVTTHNLLC